MTCRRVTPAEIGRAGAAYRQGRLPVLTLGLIPGPSPGVSWGQGDRTRSG